MSTVKQKYGNLKIPLENWISVQKNPRETYNFLIFEKMYTVMTTE